jgi:tetratricopeptide (TPR) repeat protein
VRDRLFVYFYRRRYGDPSSANPLARIAELLESFLTDTEKEAQALHHLDAGNPNYAKTLLDLMPSSNTYCEYRDGGVQFGFPSLLQEIPTIIHPEEIASAVEQLKDDPLQFYEEWKKLFETRRSKENLDTQVILQCLLALAAARSKVISQARKHLEEAYHLAREEQNPNAQILALQHWGVFSWYVEKEKEMALKYLEEAGNLAKDATHLNRRQLALYSLAVVQGNKRNHKKAIATAQEAANLAQQMGDLRKQAKSLVFKGWSLGELGKHKDAIEILTEAAELASDVGDWNKQAECLRFKGWSLGKLGKHKDAIETLTEAAELAKKVGDWNEQAQCLRHQGWNLGQLGKHKDAIEILTEAAKLASDVGDWNEQAQCLRHQGWNLGQLGKHQEAAAAASDGFDCALKANDIKEAGWNLRLLVEQAAKIPFPDVISRVSDYFDQSANQDTDDLSFPSFFVGDLITATARLEQWSELHDLALKHQNSFSKSRFLFFSDFRGVGKVWTEKAQKEGRAALYSHIAEALPIIAQIMEALPLRTREDESPTSRHLQSLVQGLVSHCSDAGVLNDIADAVREVFGEEGEIAVQEIEAFATFHASGGTEKALEHIDPDFATAIRRIWNLSDPKDELWERLKARRRGS